MRRVVQEFAGTAVMMFSMQLLEKRGAGLSPDNLVLWNTLKALYSAFIIAVLILGLGGPTGMIPACPPDSALENTLEAQGKQITRHVVLQQGLRADGCCIADGLKQYHDP